MRIGLLLTLATFVGCGKSDDVTSSANDGLVTLSANDTTLRNDFNAAKEKVRLVIIVSPG